MQGKIIYGRFEVGKWKGVSFLGIVEGQTSRRAFRELMASPLIDTCDPEELQMRRRLLERNRISMAGISLMKGGSGSGLPNSYSLDESNT
ncbi:hypothetical protein EVAR_27730_1 [Eumeta japonica]|uniref:Uncharacterized protein n=1 Tax=Eumeta variegata TaxID=151549 RepID=A0A4C1WRM7_EUMVA|nr:hypothetical protein EVAR_27730_1 [Eumeta japonica]